MNTGRSVGPDGPADDSRQPPGGFTAVHPGGEPVFIVFAARSGSTLLRVLLDAHPDLACPPETGLARTCAELERQWRVVLTEGGLSSLPDEAFTAVGRAAGAPLAAYAAQRGKPRWCDKSLANAEYHSLLRRAFPGAYFVCLVRHALDVVHSGLEASKWGFGAYGFTEYVRDSPQNTVRALLRYWCDYTERILAVSGSGEPRSATVRYEDLVRSPGPTMASLVRRLGLAPAPDLVEKAFSSSHDLGGGDHKLPFTRQVRDDSIGTGRRVPVMLIDDDLLARMNGNLERLGYPPVGRDWNSEVPVAARPGDDHAADAVSAVLGRQARLVPCDHRPEARARRFLVVAEDWGKRWLVDLRTAEFLDCRRPCAEAGHLIGDVTGLWELVDGRLNLGAGLRSGVLRSDGPMAGVVRAVILLQEARERGRNAAPDLAPAAQGEA